MLPSQGREASPILVPRSDPRVYPEPVEGTPFRRSEFYYNSESDMVDAERSPIKLNLDVVYPSEWSNLGTFLYLRLFGDEIYDYTVRSIGASLLDNPELEELDLREVVSGIPNHPARELVDQFAIDNGLNIQFTQELVSPVAIHVAGICERVATLPYQAYKSEPEMCNIVAGLNSVIIATQQVQIFGLDAKIFDHRVVAQYAKGIDIAYKSRFIIQNN